MILRTLKKLKKIIIAAAILSEHTCYFCFLKVV
jgi:hypothetical protein